MLDEARKTVEFLSRSFEQEAERFAKITELVAKYPNTEPSETWGILPILFMAGTLDSAVLRGLPYEDFLQTPYWRAVSWRVKERDKWCKMCASFLGEMHVHHSSYRFKGLEWEHLEDLILLCGECHEIFHKRRRRM